MPKLRPRSLPRPALAVIAVSGGIALVAAVLSLVEIGLMPPRVEVRDLHEGAAATRAVVDRPAPEASGPTALDELSAYNDLAALSQRAGPIAELMATPRVVAHIAERMGVDPTDISAASLLTESVPRSLVEPDSERRAAQLLAGDAPYRIEIQPEPGVPILGIYAQAPSAAEAQRLANESVDASNSFLREQARERGIASDGLVRLTQLGSARGGTVDPIAPLEIAALTFLVVFGVTAGVIVGVARIRRGWRAAARGTRKEPPPRAADIGATADGSLPADDWPHTTRLLPWLIAAFTCMIWLVPFNGVELSSSLPVDLKLDRLVLVAIVTVWAVAFLTGGRGAPVRRFTPIHAGLACFAAVAGLSVVLNAPALNHDLLLGLSIKKLSLLAAYIALFLVVASSIRPGEVRPYLNLILALAVVSAIGIIWEYRFGANVFYDWTRHLLGDFLQVPTTYGGVDDLGRREVIGPAEIGLEAVAILSMALPIAIVGLMEARWWSRRLVYGAALGILGVALFATMRKSALLAPIPIALIVAYFRPREALRLAPLALLAVAVLAISSFDGFHSVTGQFDSGRLDVPTVGDRVADYDAVRPDVLSHPALGAGFGSYEHTYAPADNRILDSDLLLRVVEVGIVGLLAFLTMIVTVIAVAAPVIRRREEARAGPALAIAAAAGAFLVLAALFDEWSFPHAVYVFLTLAGLLAAVTRARPLHVPTQPATAAETEEPAGGEPPDASGRQLPTLA